MNSHEFPNVYEWLNMVKSHMVLYQDVKPNKVILNRHGFFMKQYPLAMTNMSIENHHVSWKNPLFLWWFSSSLLVITRLGKSVNPIQFREPWNHHFPIVFLWWVITRLGMLQGTPQPASQATWILQLDFPALSSYHRRASRCYQSFRSRETELKKLVIV